MATPYAMVLLDRTTSTQDDARRLLGINPMLVVAGGQTEGRGRSGAVWTNAPQALAASLAFRCEWPTDTWPRLTLIAGVVAARVIGAGVGLKWPNDIVADGADAAVGDERKVGGILTEAADGVVVVGLGLNLFWPDPPEGVGAIFEVVPPSTEGGRLAQNWTEGMLTMLGAGPQSWPLDEYRRRCVTIGRSITWAPAGLGQAVDVDLSGALVVDTTEGRVNLIAGAVREVRVAGS